MSYEKYYPGGWQSGESGGTPITPEALNHIENGIKQAYSDCAPAGYGLGETTPKSVGSPDNALATGWYIVTDPVSGAGTGWLYCSSYSNQYKRQEFYNVTSSNKYVHVVRYMNGGIWEAWEWVNPPMVQGVEYRTTERWDDKVVYAQYFDFGYLPNNTFKSVPLPVSTRASHLVDYYGHMRYSTESAEISLHYSAIRFQLGYDGIVRIDASENLSTFAAKFVVKYTKD